MFWLNDIDWRIQNVFFCIANRIQLLAPIILIAPWLCSRADDMHLKAWLTAVDHFKSTANGSSLDGSPCSETIAISSHKIILLSDPAWTVQIPSSQIHHRQRTHRSLIRETPSVPEAMRSVLPVVQETTWRLKGLCSFEFLCFCSIDSKGISSVL